jgi:TetR/AcrR family transcriptional regulator, regulator of mycofactocin system
MSEGHVKSESLAQRLQLNRTQLMVSELEAVALRLCEEKGFTQTTVEEFAAAGGVSVRTFYRYFPSKEDVLQVRIDRRSEALRDALARRPADEPVLHSLRLALEEVLGAEDQDLERCWTSVVAATPSVLMSVMGGIQLKSRPVIAEFIASRLDCASDSLVPTMLAAAVGGVIEAGQTKWFLVGGDLATIISEGLVVLESGIGTDPIAGVHRPA